MLRYDERRLVKIPGYLLAASRISRQDYVFSDVARPARNVILLLAAALYLRSVFTHVYTSVSMQALMLIADTLVHVYNRTYLPENQYAGVILD